MWKKIKRCTVKQWCEDNDRQDILDRWDYDLNGGGPEEFDINTKKKRYLKCPRGIHPSEERWLNHLRDNPKFEVGCIACNSFAQHMIDKKGEEYLNRIWSDKNIKSPWDYTHSTNREAWFICEDNPDHIYKQRIEAKMSGCKCRYCSNKYGVLYENSVGVKYPESIMVWSDKNEKTPYEYLPSSEIAVWWKCENGKHDDYQRKLRSSKDANYKCPICSKNNIPRHKGPDHHNWKGGNTSPSIIARQSVSGKKWRAEVFKRDKYLCQICLDPTHTRLNAHHIYDFATYEDLRYAINNGIALCEQCHSNHYEGSLHYVYGNSGVTPEQLQEYAERRRAELGITEPFNIYDYINSESSSIPYPEELPPDLDPVTDVA